MMALILVPVFLLSLACTVSAIHRGIRQRRTCLSVLLGLFVMTISLPVFVIVLDGMSAGFVQEHLSLLWHLARRMTVADGDIYMGAGGLLLVVFSIILLVLQLLLLRGKSPMRSS